MIHTCTSRSFRNLSGRFRGIAPHLVMLGLVCFKGCVPDEHPIYLTNLTSTMQTVSRLLLPDNDVKNNKLDKPHGKQGQGFLRGGFQKWSFWVRGQWGPGGPGLHTLLWVSRRSSSVQEAPGRTSSCGLADAPHHTCRSGPLSGLRTLAGPVGEQRRGSVTCVKGDVLR